jgi:predicted  nucleic acid-binding Zn-ribbon protein
MSLDANDLVAIRDVMNDAFEQLFEPRFEDVDKQFDKLEGQMSGLEGRMSGLEGRMSGLEGQMSKQEQATLDLRAEMRSGFAVVNTRIDGLDQKLSGKVEALENDIKDIYVLLAKHKTTITMDDQFFDLDMKKKILRLNEELLLTAKQAGIALPR